MKKTTKIEKDFPEVLEYQTGQTDSEKTDEIMKIIKTKPWQLSLFELLTENDVLTDDESAQKFGKNYSQTIELYDFMPRFFWEQQADLRREYKGLLPNLVREFECRGVAFQLTLGAATITDQEGKSRSFYPCKSEDILETVLRKMFLDSNPQFYNGKPGLPFTISQIRKELRKQGHSRSHDEILQSLLILRGSEISVTNLATKQTVVFSPISYLNYNRNNKGNEPSYLIFSDFIADGIKALYFRRLNYKKVISYKSNIARLLHRRLSHHFTQANESLSYNIYVTTLIRDFGLSAKELKRHRADFTTALEEMINLNVVKEFKITKVMASGVLTDYHLEIMPTKAFSFEVSNTNTITKNVLQMSEGFQIEPPNAKVFPKNS